MKSGNHLRRGWYISSPEVVQNIAEVVHSSCRIQRENGVVVKKAAYVALSTDLEGRKDVLAMWLGATESSKYWLNVLTTLKNRGVKDILIVSVDGLSGFIEAIHVASRTQRCNAVLFGSA